VPSGAAGTAGGGGKRWWHGPTWVKPDEGDGRWGPTVSQARRGVKAA
jgi:hypothetical protein